MADGVEFQSATPATPPAGFKAVTDDCGTPGHAQVVKLAISTDGSATLIPADATNGIDVDVTRTPKGSKTFTDPAPTTSAAVILAANSSRKSATIHNAGTVTVYLGKDNTVTATNGLPLAPLSTLGDDVTSDAWWGITSSGTGDLRVIEVA